MVKRTIFRILVFIVIYYPVNSFSQGLSLGFIENMVGVVSNDMIVGSIKEDGVVCKETGKVTDEYLSRLRERGANQPVINAILQAVANCKDIPIKPPPSSPIATISSPSDGADFKEGAYIKFNGVANDVEDGTLTGDSLVWTSDKDGQIGTGSSFSISRLSINTHTITLTATNSRGLTGTDSIRVDIEKEDEAYETETMYITDEIRVMLRSDVAMDRRIIAMPKSGTRVEVLERSEDGWSKIRLPSDEEGWLLTRYLSPGPFSKEVIRSAIARIQEEAPKSRPRPVLEAIDKLKEEVESHEGVVMRGGVARSRVSKKTLELLDIYNAEIWHRIQKNWAFSEEMVRGRTDLEATIIVKIMKEGEIRDIRFEKRSGNSYFDHSVLTAVKKSDPLPPLPEGYLGPFYDVGFRFNLSEL